MKQDIKRIIYWWRRYEGKNYKEIRGEKVYGFLDLDLLEKRLEEYFNNPKAFDFNKPDMEIRY